MDQNKLKLNTCHDHFRHQPQDQRVIYSFGISPSGGEKTPKRGDTGRIPARFPPPLLLQRPRCWPFLAGNHNLQLRSPIFPGPVKQNTKWIMFNLSDHYKDTVYKILLCNNRKASSFRWFSFASPNIIRKLFILLFIYITEIMIVKVIG